MSKTIHYIEYQTKTVFVPLRHLYPECSVLIEGEPQLHPLKCFHDTCHRNANCMEVLANRVHYWFENVVPDAELIIAYFKWDDRPNSIRAGVFDKDFKDGRVILCNKYALKKFQNDGTVFQWVPPQDYWLMSRNTQDIIPVENLIHGK